MITPAFEQGPVQGLQDAIPNRTSRKTDDYTVEYGVRLDDQAMVFHFYPPGTDWSEYPPKKIGKWSDAYQVTTRLERAMPRVFDTKFVRGTFTDETQSFCIIVFGLGRSLDPNHWVQRFFAEIDAPL